MDSSNTVPKQLKPFVKGDPRINRKGRPKSFDALRALAQSIAHEPITEVNGHKATVAEMILRKWATSCNPQLQRAFIEVAFGKVPDNININADVNNRSTIIIKGVDYRTIAANLAPRSIPDSDSPSEGENTFDGTQVG